MPRKYISPLIWLIAGGIMCVFLLRLGEAGRLSLSQIFLFYGALAVADAGLVTHTLLYRDENSSNVNFGFKLMGEVLLFLILVTFMLGDIFFAK